MPGKAQKPHGRPRPKSARNEHFEHVEIVHVTVEVEIGYHNPMAREDALRVAKELCNGAEIGGCGSHGCYNAVTTGKPQVEKA